MARTHTTHTRRMTVTHNTHPYATNTSVSPNQRFSSPPAVHNLSPMAAGGTALSPSAHSSPATMSTIRKKTQPKSKNHGRFPCSIPGCFAVANHLSSMCRHKWGHLPQRLLPACRGHLPNGGPCPVRYQGRADTMKRHWLTHHTNEGQWVPDRYPPFEDLWKLVREGEVVLTPPSKYAYDSPPEQSSTSTPISNSNEHTLPHSPSNGHVGGGPFLNSSNPGRRSSASFSFGLGGRPNSFAGSSTTRDTEQAASILRRNSFADGMSPGTLHPMQPVHPMQPNYPIANANAREARISRGNLRPWKISDPLTSVQGVVPVDFEEDYDELEENSTGADDGHETHDGDIEMMIVDDDNDNDGATMEELSEQGAASPSHYSSARSHRSNSNPRSPASLRILYEEPDQENGHGHDHGHEQSDAHVHIHVPQVVLPPLTPLTQHERLTSQNMYPFRPRYPLVTPNYNYATVPTSNLRGTGVAPTRPYTSDARQGQGQGQENIMIGTGNGTGYVYGAKKGSPPGPGFTPASIPHSELSLLSHPPTDRILPSANTPNTTNNNTTNGWTGSSGIPQPHATVASH